MADQTLKIWAKEQTLDGVTGIYQKKIIQDNEWLTGWAREQVISAQELNTLFYLLSTHASPIPAPISYWPTASFIPEQALEMDGSGISEVDVPNLYSIYGSSLPDLRAFCPSGYTIIVRAS